MLRKRLLQRHWSTDKAARRLTIRPQNLTLHNTLQGVEVNRSERCQVTVMVPQARDIEVQVKFFCGLHLVRHAQVWHGQSKRLDRHCREVERSISLQR